MRKYPLSLSVSLPARTRACIPEDSPYLEWVISHWISADRIWLAAASSSWPQPQSGRAREPYPFTILHRSATSPLQFVRSKSHCATLFPLGPSCFHAFDRERLRNTLSRQEIVRLWKILEGRRGCLGMWNMEFGIEWDVKDVEQWCNLDLYLAREGRMKKIEDREWLVPFLSGE